MVAMWKKWFPQGWRAQVRHHKKDKGLGAICGVRIGMGEWRKAEFKMECTSLSKGMDGLDGIECEMIVSLEFISSDRVEDRRTELGLP